MITRARIGLAVLFVLLLQMVTQAVGTLTITTTTLSDINTHRHNLAWVSDAAGAVSANAATLRIGFLTQIKFIPDGGGTAPSALYDVVLVDTHGVDFLAGAGANLSATVANIVRPASPLIYDATSTLDLQVSNAGASKGGTVQLWIQRLP